MRTAQRLLAVGGAAFLVVRMTYAATIETGIELDSIGAWLFYGVAAALLLIPFFHAFRLGPGWQAVATTAALDLFVVISFWPLSYALAHIDDGLEILWVPFISAGEFVIVQLGPRLLSMGQPAQPPPRPDV